MCTLRAPYDAPSGIVQARADAVRAWEHPLISRAGKLGLIGTTRPAGPYMKLRASLHAR